MQFNNGKMFSAGLRIENMQASNSNTVEESSFKELFGHSRCFNVIQLSTINSERGIAVKGSFDDLNNGRSSTFNNIGDSSVSMFSGTCEVIWYRKPNFLIGRVQKVTLLQFDH